MSDKVRDTVVAILAEQALLAPSEVALESSPADLGIDSLGLVEAIFAIEEAFDISVPFNANDPDSNEFDISSVASVVAAVRELVRMQKTA
ncbi:phosphopantetheine-binding protein [Haematobacter missouriensis]|uniref:Phosphopantetheine-binding protein n=1 Tax=Haematobacter missouriensis TaxID=366616 RepID=A0A212AXA3_9RHOB|nr:phosphopantetheine-binding protein [Haematobacter missouriensis]KFI34100.1 phosphopantetheine-binding protein [Haematobacter missouriensis]OWJ78339.1 phosphopantetheine-binding protein [Haematobacter missouriensis]OWJ86088.1 phosphopantetheine-binding protein [Haematobacter missouriensis]